MTRSCPPGFRYLADIYVQAEAEALWSRLHSGALGAAFWNPKTPKHEPEYIPRHTWENPGVWEMLKDGEGWPFATYPFTVLVAVEEADGASETTASTTGNKGGRPPAADWGALKEALRIEYQTKGPIDPENPPGWQRQADVERWAADWLQARGDDASDGAIRANVRRIVSEMSET